MSAVSDIACELPNPEAIIIALADVAAILRAHRGVPAPLACAGGHDTARFIRWGVGLVCTGCGTRPLPADQLHALLTRQLRARVLIQPERIAA